MKHNRRDLGITTGEEDVRKLKSVSKRLSIPEKEIVRRSVEAYIQKLTGIEEELELVGFGMWRDVLEMSNSSKWVEKLRKKKWDKMIASKNIFN